MTHRLEPSGLALSRPLDADRQPRRLPLVLDDGYETVVYAHPPRGGRVGLPVLYMHGIQSHPGWFIGSAAALAESGHPVFQVTRRGSGENRRDRGHAASAGQLLDDVECAGRFVLERTGRNCLHLLGVSWGGKLLAAFATRPERQIEVASLTMVSPGLAGLVGPSVWTKIAIALSLSIAPKRRFAIPLNDPALFTDNPTMRRYMRDDGFALRRATARFLLASREMDGMIRRARDGALSKMPVTLMLAGRDRIIDNARVRDIVDRLTGGKANVLEFPCTHVPEFEQDPRFLYDALLKAVSGIR